MSPPQPIAGRGDPGELKRLEQQSQKIVRETLANLRQIFAQAEKAVKRARPWPTSLDAWSRGRALYPPAIEREIRQEASRRALMVTEQLDPQKFNEKIGRIREEFWLSEARILTDMEARTIAIDRGVFRYEGRPERGEFKHYLPGEELHIMQDRGLAGAPVELSRSNSGSWSPDPDQAINAIIPDKPGAYFFEVQYAGRDDPISVGVERRSDGSLRILSGVNLAAEQPDLKSALTFPSHWEQLPDSRSGSRGVLVYPLNPPAGSAKR